MIIKSFEVEKIKSIKNNLILLYGSNQGHKSQIIKELFEKSVDGEAYDLEKYGQYFRPAGMAYQSQVSVPKADRPAPVEKTADPVNAEVKTEAQPAPAAQPAQQPAGDSAKRAEDILKLIRSRQAK